MDRRFLIIMLTIVLAFIGIFVFSGNGEPGQGEDIGQPTNHIKGNDSKGLRLLVYGDFQCNHCADFVAIETQVMEKYLDEISYQFRHFPLGYPHSYSAARAAEAAGKQGKFFEMHDLIYSTQAQWTNLSETQNVFEQFAQQIGLDIEKYKLDFAAAESNSSINADRKLGNEAGVSGTPTYFLNDEKIDLSEIDTAEKFSKKIEEAIAKNSQSN